MLASHLLDGDTAPATISPLALRYGNNSVALDNNHLDENTVGQSVAPLSFGATRGADPG